MTTLVFIPGHMCGAWLYSPQIPDPDAEAAVIADVTQDDTVHHIAARLLDDTEGSLILVGLSLGAMVAMEVMAQAPDRVAGACLMATDPGSARTREIDWRAGLLDQGLDSYRQTFVSQFYRHSADVADQLGAHTLAKMGETPDHVTLAQTRALDTRRDMLPLIRSFSRPVEILVGSEDRVCPAKLHEPLAAALPNAAMTVVPGCGHIATLEAPEPCTRAISRLRARL